MRSVPAMVSVVLPVYNERQNLDTLVERLVPLLAKVSDDSFEILFVDDGSRDGSAEYLDEICTSDPRLKVIHFSRNFGHQPALQAGLDAAQGKAVILMDADLQDPPEVINHFIDNWRRGFDVVYAVRRKRKENLIKRGAYSVFYRTMKLISNIDVPLDVGDFCLMDREVVKTLGSLPERNRFLRGLRAWVGFRQIGVEYERDARHAGAPKYTLRKLVALALSGYVGFSAMPLRAAAWLGLLSAVGGFFIALWVLVDRLTYYPSPPRGWASTMSVILFVGGVQLMVLGVIGEYLGRVYDEVRHRPLYVVRSRVGVFSYDEPPVKIEPTNGYLIRR